MASQLDRASLAAVSKQRTRLTHHVVVDEGSALLDEPGHGEGQVLHRAVRHRLAERREPAAPGLRPHGGLAVGVGAEAVAVEPVAGVDLDAIAIPQINVSRNAVNEIKESSIR